MAARVPTTTVAALRTAGRPHQPARRAGRARDIGGAGTATWRATAIATLHSSSGSGDVTASRMPPAWARNPPDTATMAAIAARRTHTTYSDRTHTGADRRSLIEQT